MDLFPHKSERGVQPVALIGHNVCILWANTQTFYRVRYFEPIPPFQCLNIGAVAAGTTANPIRGQNLDVNDNEFAQFRWYPIDNAQVRLWLPQADGRFLTKQAQAPVDMNVVERDPCLHMTEFFVWGDHSPWFQAINGMDYALNACRIIAFGFRYVVEQLSREEATTLTSRKEPCVMIPCTGNQGIPTR